MKRKLLIGAFVSISVAIGVTATTYAMKSSPPRDNVILKALNKTLKLQRYEVYAKYPLTGEEYKTPSTVIWKEDESQGIMNLNQFPTENVGINQLQSDGFIIGNHSIFQHVELEKSDFIEKKDQMFDDIKNARELPSQLYNFQ